jgi:transposase
LCARAHLGAICRNTLARWYSVWNRFRRWALKGTFETIFRAVSADPDFEYALIDGTIVKVHRHGTGAKGGLSIKPSANRGAG